MFEAALKEFLGFGILERTRARSELSEEEALAMAYEEIHAMREGR